jgi:stress response protein YsnF
MGAYDEVAAWPIMTCETCAYPYGQEAPYMKSCSVCFKEANGYKMLKGDLAVARLQLALEQERAARVNPTAEIDQELHAALQRENEELKATIQRLKAESKAAKRAQRGTAPADPPITRERVLSMIKLCHPDKNQNSELSTEVTKWLLDIKANL